MGIFDPVEFLFVSDTMFVIIALPKFYTMHIIYFVYPFGYRRFKSRHQYPHRFRQRPRICRGDRRVAHTVRAIGNICLNRKCLGIITHSPNIISLRISADFTHSWATILPASLNIILPLVISPNIDFLSCVQIVMKYTSDCE